MTDRGRVVVYTARPHSYSDIEAEVLSGDVLVNMPSAEAFLAAKHDLLKHADVALIDFEGFTDMTPLSLLFGAVQRLTAGQLRTVIAIGLSEPPLERFTVDPNEREALARAKTESRLQFFPSLECWLAASEEVP